MNFSIQNHLIGARKTFVIAEIGVNHDGSVDRAIELVGHAKKAGADAVKLQIFNAKTLMHPSGRFAKYQKTTDANPIEMLSRYELTIDQCRAIVKAIVQTGLIPLATPFSLSDIPTLAELNFPAIKIASPDLANPLLLLNAAKLGKPLLLSTGAASIEEVADAIALLQNKPIALLHCVSAYPTPSNAANLGWIVELSRRFDCPVGFSDHTQETLTGALAVGAGACIVEKHLTWNKNAPGPDHSASADPEQFAYYVKMIRKAETLLGEGAKSVLPHEQDVREVSRQSLAASRDLPAGHVIAMEDLITRRPGNFIPASKYRQVLGKPLTQPLKSGEFLPLSLLENNFTSPAALSSRPQGGIWP